MSEYTDAMLEGIFCQTCGDLLIEDDEEPCGFPKSCESCKDDDEEE